MSDPKDTDGRAVLLAIEHGLPLATRAGRLPVGRFTPDEFAQLLARIHPRNVHFEDGVIVVDG